MPYEVLYGHKSSELKHTRPFGYRFLYHPVANKLSSFAPSLDEGLYLGQCRGGVYYVLTRHGVVRTRHVKMYETSFPGISLVEKSSNFHDDHTLSDGEEELE